MYSWDTQLTHQETDLDFTNVPLQLLAANKQTHTKHKQTPNTQDRHINIPLQLLAALLGATAMATWHAALFMEMEKIHEPGFPLTWPDWLQVTCRLLIS